MLTCSQGLLRCGYRHRSICGATHQTKRNTQMNKYSFFALALAPMVCMTVQATPEDDAAGAIKATMSNLTTLVKEGTAKDLPTLISELDSLLARATPNILTQLEPLTNEQRKNVIIALSGSPEFMELMEVAALLQQSQAANELMPVIGGVIDPQTYIAGTPLKTKLQVIDICANLLKISLGLGIDSPEVMSIFAAEGQ